MTDVDPFLAVTALPDLARTTFKTPGAGNVAKPFTVREVGRDEVVLRTSRGGRVTLRAEAFFAAHKALADLGAVEEGGWVRTSDETLGAILATENREHGVTSYVLPLLEAAGLVELDRGRPARARVRGAR